jgi:hypothetical protein
VVGFGAKPQGFKSCNKKNNGFRTRCFLFLFAVIDNYELKSTEEGVFKKFPANKKRR